MDLIDKLNEYIAEKGLKKAWFAEKLGLTRQQFASITNKHQNMPLLLWPKVSLLTEGHVKIGEVIELVFDGQIKVSNIATQNREFVCYITL